MELNSFPWQNFLKCFSAGRKVASRLRASGINNGNKPRNDRVECILEGHLSIRAWVTSAKKMNRPRGTWIRFLKERLQAASDRRRKRPVTGEITKPR